LLDTRDKKNQVSPYRKIKALYEIVMMSNQKTSNINHEPKILSWKRNQNKAQTKFL
jgi:hypothetical protein